MVVETSSIGSRTPKKTKEVPRSQEPTVSSSSSFSAVKSTSSSQSSSTSSESHNDINNRLDYLASNLDPWAHIQHAEHQVTTTASPLVQHIDLNTASFLLSHLHFNLFILFCWSYFHGCGLKYIFSCCYLSSFHSCGLVYVYISHNLLYLFCCGQQCV